jgi:hypothetical protein
LMRLLDHKAHAAVTGSFGGSCLRGASAGNHKRSKEQNLKELGF